MKNPIHRIQKNDQYVEFIPQQAQKTIGIPNGNKITYSNIYPSVDISYTVLASGVKEDIILLNSSAQHTYTFGIQTEGLTPKLNDHGEISFLDQENNEIFQASRAFAFDNQEVYTEKVTTNLRQEDDDWFIDISLDQQWLQDPSRQFPVTIDTTINFQTNDSAQRTRSSRPYVSRDR